MTGHGASLRRKNVVYCRRPIGYWHPPPAPPSPGLPPPPSTLVLLRPFMSPNNYSSINAARKHKSTHPRRRWWWLPRPNRLEALRIAIFALVFVSSLIALALAAHFLTVLQSNDLTHFIPFALFTSVASMIGMIALTGVVLVHKSKPVALKVELAIMAFVGILWLILSIFISTSPAESADVQCFSDGGDLLDDLDGPFDSELFHAQYRALMAIGSVNAFILLILCAVLTYMALRHFTRTRDWVSTTRKPLLGEKSKSRSREKSRSRSQPAPPLTDLPQRVGRKPATPAKEKTKTSGLPLPATARGATRDPATRAAAPSRPSPPSKPPPLKSKPTPAPPAPKRPPIAKSKSTPLPPKDKPSTSKAVNPVTPPPKAKVAPVSGTRGASAPKPVARGKTR